MSNLSSIKSGHCWHDKCYVINQGFPSEINNAAAVLTLSKSDWFRLQRHTIAFKNWRQFFHPIRSKIKTNRNSLARFPASATCINYEF